MRVIEPIEITDAILTSSNIPENEYGEFSMATTYGVGDFVIDSTGVEILTLNVAPATPWVAGRLVQELTSSSSASASPSPSVSPSATNSPSRSPSLSPSASASPSASKSPSRSPSTSPSGAASSSLSPSRSPSVSPSKSPSKSPSVSPSESPSAPGFASCRIVAQLTALTYQIRERDGVFGTAGIIGVVGIGAEQAHQGASFPTVTAATDKVHKIYESLRVANLSNYPPDNLTGESPWWSEISATNKWKAFDGKVGSKTITDILTYV